MKYLSRILFSSLLVFVLAFFVGCKKADDATAGVSEAAVAPAKSGALEALENFVAAIAAKDGEKVGEFIASEEMKAHLVPLVNAGAISLELLEVVSEKTVGGSAVIVAKKVSKMGDIEKGGTFEVSLETIGGKWKIQNVRQ